jgi:hypothetical protein
LLNLYMLLIANNIEDYYPYFVGQFYYASLDMLPLIFDFKLLLRCTPPLLWSHDVPSCGCSRSGA